MKLKLTVFALMIAAGFASAEDARKEVKVAAICTAYAKMWHADVIVTKFLAGFPTDEGLIKPKVKIVSMYLDQDSPDHLGHKIAEHYGIPLFPTVTEALTLGTDKLAVDAVLFIGEHGSYPKSRLGAIMYPRMRIAEEIFRVFEFSGRSVPLFHDKHLSYNWLDSKWVYDRAKELDVPMMAGSCIPLCWRDPPLEHPLDSNITEAVVLLYASPEAYGVHGVEMLQCMVERRKGRETGIKSVQHVQGKAFFKAAEEGKIPMDLVEAAAATIDEKKPGKMQDHAQHVFGIILEYTDGMRGVVVMCHNYYGANWAYAARVDGRIAATRFNYVMAKSVPSFSYLGLNIQQMFLTGRPQYPVERTLLSSGVVDAALRSAAAGGAVIETPYLHIKYEPYNFDPVRPNGTHPIGASLMEWPPEEIRHLYEK
jgi:hypothetical protein